MSKIIIVKFGTNEDITGRGEDGQSIRFPYTFIDQQFVGTPRQTAETKRGRITVQIVGGRRSTWNLSEADLKKELFQIAIEKLDKRLQNSKGIDQDIKVSVDSMTYPSCPPFDPQYIQQPEGATVQFEIRNPIGF